MKIFVRSLLTAAWFALTVGATTSATSHAGMFDVVEGALVYQDFGTVDNDLRIAESGGTYYISDPADLGVVVTQGFIDAGCLDGVLITCPTAAINGIQIESGNGTDTIDLAGVLVPTVVYAGPGFDRIVGGKSTDVVAWWPGDGADEFDGGPARTVTTGSSAARAPTRSTAAPVPIVSPAAAATTCCSAAPIRIS